MTTIVRIGPSTPNVGNDAIRYATAELLRQTFGPETNVVDVPALTAGRRGGLTATQVYDVNRFADGVVIGGGNLLENGQLTVDEVSVDALRPPLLLLGLAHGRIDDDAGELIPRTDSLPPATIRSLGRKAVATVVRDHGSFDLLLELGVSDVAVGGCPTLFLPEGREPHDGRILLSIRHPSRMSVSAAVQWRTPADVRRLAEALGDEGEVMLVCHDYADLEFAAGFPDIPSLYFDDVYRYLDALRRCRLSVTYRLHAFLPCVAFGTPSIHLSYDERGRSCVATAGMGAWDVDLVAEGDVVEAVLGRCATLDVYAELRQKATTAIAALRATTEGALTQFADAVRRRQPALR